MQRFAYLSGVYNITPTPFEPDGSLDEESVRSLVEFSIGKGVNWMTILGVLGEVDKLSDYDRDQIIAATVSAADERVPICGTSRRAKNRESSFKLERPAQLH